MSEDVGVNLYLNANNADKLWRCVRSKGMVSEHPVVLQLHPWTDEAAQSSHSKLQIAHFGCYRSEGLADEEW